jgi:hypothetical protein
VKTRQSQKGERLLFPFMLLPGCFQCSHSLPHLDQFADQLLS